MSRSVENVLTQSGMALLARSLSEGRPVVFTRAELGTGIAADEADLTAFTELIAKYANATVAKKRILTDGQLIVTVQFVNAEVRQTVYIEEIGLFAKLGAGGGRSEEADSAAVLFSYMTFGATPDLILSVDMASVQRVYDIPYIFNGTASVTVTISPSGMITNADVTTSGGAEDEHGESKEGKLVSLNAAGKLDVDITGDANTLDGHDSDYFAVADHDHDDATQQVHGYMSTADKARHDEMSRYLNQSLKTTDSPTFAGLTVNGYIDGARFR